MSEREIAAVLKVSHMSVNRTMKNLAELNFADMIVVGNSHLWRVNRRSYSYSALSELVKNISRIQSPFGNLKLFLSKKLPNKLVEKAVLFGSISKKKEKTNSDIDVFILVKNKKNREKLDAVLEKLSNACLEKYGNRLSPYIVTGREMSGKKNLKVLLDVNKGIQIIPKKKDNYDG